MNANIKNARPIVTVLLAVLGTAGWLVGCSSSTPLGSVGGDDASSGSGGAGIGGSGGGGTGGGGQSCPSRPGAEGSACTAAQEGCSRCAYENVVCCRQFLKCERGVWSPWEAGPCPADGGSIDTSLEIAPPETAAPVNQCPATSPGNSGAICTIDERVFCFYGSAYDQEQCRCLGGKVTVDGKPVAPPWQCSRNGTDNGVLTDCKTITPGCTPLPPESNVMCTGASSCSYCCGGGTAITTCTCQPGQLPSCQYTGSCGG